MFDHVNIVALRWVIWRDRRKTGLGTVRRLKLTINSVSLADWVVLSSTYA